MDNAVLLD